MEDHFVVHTFVKIIIIPSYQVPSPCVFEEPEPMDKAFLAAMTKGAHISPRPSSTWRWTEICCFFGGEGLQTWSVGVINLEFSGVQVGFEEKSDCWDVLLDIFALWEKKHLFTIDMVVSLVWCALLKLHHFFHKWVLLWTKNAGYDALLTVKSDACYYTLHL